MRVAWISNHPPGERPPESVALLPGALPGGAEMTDLEMIEHAPAGVIVDRFGADGWEQTLDHDRIVVTGTDRLSDAACAALADRHPLVWVHHQQPLRKSLAHLFRAAGLFVAMSQLHSRLEGRQFELDARPQVCHGALDPDCVQPGEKTLAALWAARNHPQKGRIPARIWAYNHDINLTEITNRPRVEVLAAMSAHKWFVFLPQAFDSCPRTLIEAELAGCEIVTNQLVGRRDPGDIREVLDRQAPTFWGWL